MAVIDFDEIEGMEKAKTDDEAVETVYLPRLLEADKVKLAENAVPIFIQEIIIQESTNSSFERKPSKNSELTEEELKTFWSLIAICENTLKFPKIKTSDGRRGRDTVLEVLQGEPFQFSLSRHDKRESTMQRLIAANRAGVKPGDDYNVIGPVELFIMEYTSNGAAVLTIRKHAGTRDTSPIAG